METSPSTPNDPVPSGPVENRAPARLPAALVPSITGLRLSPHGIDARLVDISTTGLLAECGIRLKVGSAVTVSFSGTFKPKSAEGRVVRCAVAAMGKNGGLVYHVGVAFEDQIALAVPGVTPAEPVAAPSESTPARSVVRNRW